ncbi:pentapeptide repeat-containing protein [Yersinia wautersii]|uniref:Pentapeptide repeat-containing protein n=1 Tax=Yersinia wautersii TaxID=1341643 RepID=A0ABP1ZEY5_9GAMM|nr:pentapeptide repeat-containing protein [Yersinia wautersii]CRG49827.1 pentapeptide repeat-containing protein [Yersinia wautersii]
MGPLSSPSNVYSIPNSEPGKNTFLDDEEKGFAILMKKISKDVSQADQHDLQRLKRAVLENICEDNTASTTLMFSGMDFRGVDLSNLNLSGAELDFTDLSDTNMTNTNLKKAFICNAKLNNIHWENTDITDISIELDDIHLLPLTAPEQYKMLEKNVEIIENHNDGYKEIDKIEKFKEVLDVKNKIQQRFHNLDNKQLQILLPCLYVEAAHRLNPVMAYREKDKGYSATEENDNVLMIEGYTSLLSTLNNALTPNENQCHAERVKNIALGIEKLIEILLGSNTLCIENLTSYFRVHNSQIYKFKTLHKEIEKGKLTLNALKYDIGLTIDTNGEVTFNGVIDNTIENKNKILYEFSNKLVSAHAKNDIVEIFKLTSDFQYLHLLPNANGRVSQIIRDCFSIHLGQLPFSALNSMSHYLYLNEPVDKRHLLFMQNNFDEVFTAIEKRELTVNIYRKTRPENQEELLIMSKDEPVIKLDVDILAASLEHNKKIKNDEFEAFGNEYK